MGLFKPKRQALTRETLVLLKTGMSTAKVEKMFGPPDHKGDSSATIKKMFGENMERLVTMSGNKNDLFRLEKWGYDVPGGLITLDFDKNKLGRWQFHEGSAWNSEAFGNK